MKLITLNLWGGTVYKPLLSFLEERADTTDIFCFQEILFGTEAGFSPEHKARLNLFEEIEKRLPAFTALKYYAPEYAGYFQREALPEGTRAGQAIFVRSGLKAGEQGGFRTYAGGIPDRVNKGGLITGSCQWAEIGGNEDKVLILNLHGLWQQDTNKADTPERLTQSRILKDFLDSRKGKKILAGDFNLNPGTQSLGILEEGMTDLIAKYGITSTRTSLYAKPERFADYILVSPEVEEKRFEVLPDEVSDHNALLLDFDSVSL